MIYNFEFGRDFSKFVNNNHECLMMCKAVAGEFKDYGRGTTLSPSSEDILSKLFTSCKARFVQANPIKYEDFGSGISFEAQMFAKFELATVVIALSSICALLDAILVSVAGICAILLYALAIF